MSDYEVRSSELWEDTRFTVESDNGKNTLDGYVAVFNSPSRLLSVKDLMDPEGQRGLAASGKRFFREMVHPGAFTKSLSEQPDIVLHYQHDERSLPLARTKAGTMSLNEDTRGIHVTADLPDNEWGRPVRDAIQRGDIGGLSFRMGHVLQRWGNEKLADGYSGPVRHLTEIRLRREVSLVTFGGYDTPTSIRELAEAADLEPDKLAEAFNVLRDPEAKLTDEQHELLQTAIGSKVETPYLNPKLASMREKLGPAPVALAG